MACKAACAPASLPAPKHSFGPGLSSRDPLPVYSGLDLLLWVQCSSAIKIQPAAIDAVSMTG